MAGGGRNLEALRGLMWSGGSRPPRRASERLGCPAVAPPESDCPIVGSSPSFGETSSEGRVRSSVPDRIVARVLALGAVIVASGCASGGEVVPGDCLPGQEGQASLEQETRVAVASSLHVYIDVSQSTTNFGRGGRESPWRDLLAWLLDRAANGSAEMYGFAERIAEMDEAAVRRAAEGQVSPCQTCGFGESRLDEVLGVVAAASEGAMSVVVTDLWLENSNLVGSGRLALQGPVRRILEDGRAIGLLGVAAPYTSQVYDVPGLAGGASAIPAGSVRQRPVFMLMIGPPSEVVSLGREVLGEVFPHETGSPEGPHFTLFTPTLAIRGVARHRLAVRSPFARHDYVLEVDGADVPEFLIQREAGPPSADNGGSLSWDIAAPISFGGEVPSPTTYDLDASMWRLMSPRSSVACDDAWVPLDLGDALQVVEEAGGAMLGFDASHRDVLAVLPGDIAFVRYRIMAGAFEHGAGGEAWLKDWSFESADGPGLAADPPHLFPVLNLRAFGRILETAMAEHVTGETVAQGMFLFTVERE